MSKRIVVNHYNATSKFNTQVPDDKDRHTCAVGYELGAAAITTGG